MAAAGTENPTSTATDHEQPTLLSRLERLDIMMGYLEEIWESRVRNHSYAPSSTASAGTPQPSGGCGDGTPASPTSPVSVDDGSLEKGCRPLADVVLESKVRGSLVNRLQYLEEQILQLSLQVEEEIEAERRREKEESSPKGDKKLHGKKTLKSLVKSCVKGKPASEK